MNRKKPIGKQKECNQKKVDWNAREIVHPDAAGIAVGGSEHWVAVSPDRDPEPRRFRCFTVDLRERGVGWWRKASSAIQRMQKVLTEMNAEGT